VVGELLEELLEELLGELLKDLLLEELLEVVLATVEQSGAVHKHKLQRRQTLARMTAMMVSLPINSGDNVACSRTLALSHPLSNPSSAQEALG